MLCPEVIFALILPFPEGINKVTIWPLLFFILTPLFAILMLITSFKERRIFGRVFSIVLILVLTFPIVVTGGMFYRRYQPRFLIREEPVINQENLPVYKECILYSKKHDEDKTMMLNNGYRVIIGGKFYMLVEGNRVERDRTKKDLTEVRVAELKKLCKKLYGVKCVRFARYNEFLVFYKVAYTSKVSGPGIVYSLNGLNPNEVDYKILNECKPFVNIAGNWYTSPNLMVTGPRCDKLCPLSDTLFENSLKIDDDIRKLLEAENW